MPSSKKRFYIYCSAIILLVILPLNKLGEINNIFILQIRADYFLHFFLFIPWFFFFKTFNLTIWLWLFAGLFFSAFAECIQYLLPYRAFNINDLIGNAMGVLLGLALYRIWISLFRKGIKNCSKLSL